MNKRGQVYLIFSLIIGLVIFVLTSQSNLINIGPKDNSFKDISKNYNHESNKVIGSLIKEGKTTDEISKQFTSFSVLFTQYSKSRNPSFGLIYILSYNNIVYVGNFLDKSIDLIDISNKVIPPSLQGCFSSVPVTIDYGNFRLDDETNYKTFQQSACFRQVSAPQNKIELTIGDEEVIYEIYIHPNQAEVVVISRERVRDDRLVFVEDEFIKGKKHTK